MEETIYCSSATNKLQHRILSHSSSSLNHFTKDTQTPLLAVPTVRLRNTTIFWCKHEIHSRFCTEESRHLGVYYEKGGQLECVSNNPRNQKDERFKKKKRWRTIRGEHKTELTHIRVSVSSSLQVLMASGARHPSPHDALSSDRYRPNPLARFLRAAADSKAHLPFTLPDQGVLSGLVLHL